MESIAQKTIDTFIGCPLLLIGGTIIVSRDLDPKDVFLINTHINPINSEQMLEVCAECGWCLNGEHTPSASGRFVMLKVAGGAIEGSFQECLHVLVK